MVERLTARRVETARAVDGKRTEIADAECQGLSLRVAPTGLKSWIVRHAAGRRSWRETLGEWPAMGLAEAREAAGVRRHEVRQAIRSGRDPSAERRAAAAEAKAARLRTVEKTLDRYAAQHLARLRDGVRRERQLRAALASHAQRPFSELRTANLAEAVDAKAATAPVAANRLRAALMHLCRWAEARGLHDDDLGRRLPPPTREQVRDRVLSDGELGTIWRAAGELGPLWCGFVRLLMLTAQRRGDLAGMGWDEIDGAAWSIPAARAKTGRPHVVHLSAPARAELDALRVLAAETGRRSRLVFTTTERTPVSGFGTIKRRLDKLSGVEGWTFHDFRTAFATAMAEAGEPEGVVDRVLNHAAAASRASTVARTYQRSALLEQRARVLDRWAARVLRAAGEATPAEVVELRR